MDSGGMNSRRSVMRAAGGLAVAPLVAGCLGGDGADGDGSSDGNDGGNGDGSDGGSGDGGGTTTTAGPAASEGSVERNEVEGSKVVDLNGQVVETDDGRGYRVTGAIENTGGGSIRIIEIRVILYDESGSKLATMRELGVRTIHPANRSEFRVTTTDVDPEKVARYEIIVFE